MGKYICKNVCLGAFVGEGIGIVGLKRQAFIGDKVLEGTRAGQRPKARSTLYKNT